MKKVLFIGFTPVQFELARKFVTYRGLHRSIELLTEQQRDSATLDAYVINGDDPSAQARLALYSRVTPAPAIGIGSRAVLGVTHYLSGPFKPATADRLNEILSEAKASPPPVSVAANVVSFPGATVVPSAEVLVVDDSEIVRRTMVRKINEYGHRVDVASDGNDALAMLLDNKYKLVFLDLMMPGMDGFEVCKRIKRSAEYKSSAVYMLSSKDGMFDKVRGSMAGCDGYLVKPLESRKLREVLDKYFDRPSIVGESEIASGQANDASLSATELAAVEGTPPPEALLNLPDLPQRDFETTFAPTAPASLEDLRNLNRR